MTESNRHAPSGAADRVSSFTTAGPYAGPARGPAARGASAAPPTVVPYVPAPFRGKPVIGPSAESEELPSIADFLSATPAHNAAVESPPSTPSNAQRSDAATAGQWPLDEAGAELQRIGDLFEAPPAERAGLFEGALDEISGARDDRAKSSKPMWRTDEWMDIMPVSPTHASHNASDESEPTDAERAANALDAIAQRVRRGEISVAGFHESMSDATLLASLLTAMLGRGR